MRAYWTRHGIASHSKAAANLARLAGKPEEASAYNKTRTAVAQATNRFGMAR